MNLWNALGRFSVPIFLMCSGVLFLNKKELTYNDILKKYISRLLIAFIFWNCIYALYNANFNLYNSFNIIKKNIASIHLWFIILIVGIYLIMPSIRIFVNYSTKKDIRNLLIALFVIQSVIPFLGCFKIFSCMKTYYGYLYTNDFIGYVGIFIYGYYLDKYEEDISRKKKILLYFLGIILIISTVILNLLETDKLSKISTPFLKFLYPNIIIYTTAIFIAVKDICKKIKMNKNAESIIAKIAQLIFGVYLVHMLVLKILSNFGINVSICNTFISIPIISLVIFLISLVIVFIISKIPILRKVIL